MERCPNCNTDLEEQFKYCPECGQETNLDKSLKSLLSHFLSDYFTFDSKIARSIVPLITKPAYLTVEYLKGRRVQYIQPLRLFIFLSIIFFLVLSLSSTAIDYSSEYDDINDATWDRFFDSWLPKLFFVLLPMFALIISWLYKKQKRGLLPHFLFALHFHASLFLIGIVYELISIIFAKLEWVIVNEIFILLLGIYLAIYLWKGLRKMYGESRKRTVWKYIVLAISYAILLVCSSIALAALSYNY